MIRCLLHVGKLQRDMIRCLLHVGKLQRDMIRCLLHVRTTVIRTQVAISTCANHILESRPRPLHGTPYTNTSKYRHLFDQTYHMACVCPFKYMYSRFCLLSVSIALFDLLKIDSFLSNVSLHAL